MSRVEKMVRLNYAELAFFTLVLWFRLDRIYDLFTMDPFTRRVLSEFDYEAGWGLYYCVLGIMGCLLIALQKMNWTAWNLKLVAYICMLSSFGHNYYSISILCIAAIAFYNLQKIKPSFFQEEGKTDFLKWLFIPIFILLVITEAYFPFLYY